jgi:hypothetical protein
MAKPESLQPHGWMNKTDFPLSVRGKPGVITVTPYAF